jgi:hypothetical protein
MEGLFGRRGEPPRLREAERRATKCLRRVWHEATMIVNKVIGLAKTVKVLDVPVNLTTVVAGWEPRLSKELLREMRSGSVNGSARTCC